MFANQKLTSFAYCHIYLFQENLSCLNMTLVILMSANQKLTCFANCHVYLFQENVSCLNMTLVILMFANQKLTCFAYCHVYLFQENVSCLNTTLVILMFSNQKSQMPNYLKSLRDEKATPVWERKGGLQIMRNFRYAQHGLSQYLEIGCPKRGFIDFCVSKVLQNIYYL